MTEQEPKQSGFDNSWAAWKDRLGITGVIVALLLIFFFMFTDASINFQCGVMDFITFKCNRFDRKFVPWDKLEKQRGKSSFLPVKGYGGNRLALAQWSTIGREMSGCRLEMMRKQKKPEVPHRLCASQFTRLVAAS